MMELQQQLRDEIAAKDEIAVEIAVVVEG